MILVSTINVRYIIASFFNDVILFQTMTERDGARVNIPACKKMSHLGTLGSTATVTLLPCAKRVVISWCSRGVVPSPTVSRANYVLG